MTPAPEQEPQFYAHVHVDRAALFVGGMGGYLRCEACGERLPLGDVRSHMADGWPTCCGHTMRWWTQRQVDAGEDQQS